MGREWDVEGSGMWREWYVEGVMCWNVEWAVEEYESGGTGGQWAVEEYESGGTGGQWAVEEYEEWRHWRAVGCGGV